MTDPIRLDNLTPQQRRDLLAQLMAAEASDTARRSHPLSCTQERLWFLDRLEPNSPAYIMPRVLRLTGPLQIPALRQSIATLVARHESLRTLFAQENDRPVQLVRDSFDQPFVVVDLTTSLPAAREAEAQAIIQREISEPFDLTRGPLLRVHLLRMGDADHILILSMHHIIADGWSLAVLCDELRQLYDDHAAGRPPSLKPVSLQFADYARWERDRLDRGEFDGPIAQWKEILAGAPPVLDLPVDFPRPAAQSHRGKRLWFEINPQIAAGLRNLARAEGATLYMVLLSIFEILMHRHSGQEDIVIGTPVANRNRCEVEGVVGFFANTLPLRVRIDGDKSVRGVIRSVRDAALALYAVAEVPFERLVQELQPERKLSHSPVFQVMLSYDSTGPRDWRLGEARGRVIRTDAGIAKFDLMFHFEDEPDSLIAYLEFNTDLFTADTAQGMVRHFLNLAQAAIRDPQASVAQVQMLSPDERAHIVETCNATDFDFGDEASRCLHELFEAQAARTPDAVAVRFAGRHITFAQLDERAGQLAKQLCRLGVGPDALVAIFMDRSIEMVTALLATLKAGGAYVPIDPGYPANRIAFMLEDSRAVAILTQSHLRDRLPAHSGPVITLDADGHADGHLAHTGASDLSPATAAASESPHGNSQLAYVIHTSGSTGRPKGVAIEHRAIVNHMLWMARVFPLAPADRVLQKTPISFDASVWEFYAPLLSGAQLVMAAPGIQRSPSELIQAVIDEGITTLQLVPTMLEAMLDEPLMRNCTTLRRLFCGGEALPTHLVQRLQSALPKLEIINLYGPTEAAIDATYWRCHDDNASQPSQPMQPIGRPIDNMRAYVLDGHMQPQPAGVPGNLYLGGAGLARGYLHQPDLTAERFVPDTITGRPHSRLYKTGDRARLRHDGAIEFLGRADHQVKLRGHRIELGEIEAVLARQPGIAACVVVVREDDPLNPLLAAYVVPAATSDHAGDAADDANAADHDRLLRDGLRAELPDYMVPAAFIRLDAFPLLPSGKVDRAALPVPQRSPAASDAVRASPRSPLEESLAAIWREILKISAVGIDDNFFDLGGHSLMAARIISRIRSTLGLELPLRIMFESPTLAGLARAIEQMPARSAPVAAPIRRIDRAKRMVRTPVATTDGPGKDEPR